MKHLGPSHSIKRLLWNQAGGGGNWGQLPCFCARGDKTVTVRGRQRAHGTGSAVRGVALAFAGICVRNKWRADHAHRRLVGDVDDSFDGGGRMLVVAGCPTSEL